MEKVEVKLWNSPTQCGCIIEKHTIWGDVDEVIEKEVDAILLKIGKSESSFKDKTSYDTFRGAIKETTDKKAQNCVVKIHLNSIISQCQEHAAFTTPEELNNELSQYTSILYSPDTCQCKLVYYYHNDARDILIPIYDAEKTVQCPVHANILTVAELHQTIVKENAYKNNVVNQISKDLQIEVTEIPFEFDSDRNIKIDVNKFKPENGVIDTKLLTEAINKISK